VARVHHYVGDAGRDPASSRANAAFAPPARGRGLAKQVDAWKALGASYLSAEARNGGLKLPDGRTFTETVRS
jgi:hypothetical protein